MLKDTEETEKRPVVVFHGEAHECRYTRIVIELRRLLLEIMQDDRVPSSVGQQFPEWLL